VNVGGPVPQDGRGPLERYLARSRAVFGAAGRLGAFDPLFSAARIAGLTRWGPGLGAMVTASAIRFPQRQAIIDETGSVGFATLDQRVTHVAGALRARLGAGDHAIGILGRNHRGFLEAQLAVERAGFDVVLLSTALPASGLAAVIERERLSLVVADHEFVDLVGDAGFADRLVHSDGEGTGSLDGMAGQDHRCPRARRRSRLVLLTSGTTGPPKGARRGAQAPGLDALSLFDVLPYRVGDVHHPAAPLFHAWALSQASIALATGSTVVLRRRFDAGTVLDLLEQHRVTVLSVVPVMLSRLLGHVGHDPDASGRNFADLRIVATSGDVLSGQLANAFMDHFGDRLYNLYGSTEASIATIAGPADLRAAPGTVGRPPAGVTVEILDAEGRHLPPGERGRVFVANSMQFEGYSDGGDRERREGMMATADHGWFDQDGRLFVEGREDDMIVTGGENVFPSEVEEVLDGLPGVERAAVVGAPDEEYGQVVVAFVVPMAPGSVDVEDLRARSAASLAQYKVPRRITLVDALPTTTTGKVMRNRLLEARLEDEGAQGEGPETSA
jgi:acyl-CoA synthetase (AMP-forming)/AMP-acid ligase II